MLIALLALLGVELIVLVGFAAVVISRKRWVKHQPGVFRGVIRVNADGATAEVAAKAEDAELLLGPYRKPADATAAGSGRL